jgi:pimeloyl-ACP methyl ester carboxylesterase
VLLGSSWGAMLALAYAAAHPRSTGPLILVGCGTFDLGARVRMRETIEQRMSTDIRTRLQDAERLADADERLKSLANALPRSTRTTHYLQQPAVSMSTQKTEMTEWG